MVNKDGFHIGGSIMRTDRVKRLEFIINEADVYNYSFFSEIISSRICFKIYAETYAPIKYLLHYSVQGNKYNDIFNVFYIINKDMYKIVKELLDGYIGNERKTVSYLEKMEYVITSGIIEYTIFCEKAMNYFEIVYGNKCIIISDKESNEVVHQLLYVYRDILFRTCINNNGVLLHAACFVHNSKSYLLLGDKCAGKTTILINCITSLNCLAIANDRALILDNSIFPFPMPLRIGRDTILNNKKLYDYISNNFNKLTRVNKNITSFTDYINNDSNEKIELTVREFEECFCLNIIENIELGGIFILENELCSEFAIHEMKKEDVFDMLNKQNYSISDPLWSEPWIVKYKYSKSCIRITSEKEIEKIMNRIPVFKIKYDIHNYDECIKNIGYLLKG